MTYSSQAGTTLDESIFYIEEIASQTKGHDQIDVGDSFTFHAVLDLTAVDVDDKSDLKFEAFAMSSTQGE